MYINTKTKKKLMIVVMIVAVLIIIISIPSLIYITLPQGQFTTTLTPGMMESNNSEHSLYILNATTGAYTYYVKCMDESGNLSDEMPATFNVAMPSDGVQVASNTGGGGGGSGSISVQQYYTIKAGASKIFDKIPDDIGITKIVVYAKNDMFNAGLNIKKTSKGSLAEPALYVYKYAEITPIKINENDISMITISFKVDKQWVKNNSINSQKIYLNRYNNGWNKLSSILVKEDTGFYYYESSIPGFSVFAITGDIDIEQVKQQQAPVSKFEEQKPVEQKPITQPITQPTQQLQTQQPQQMPLLLLFGVLTAVVIIVVVILMIIFHIRKKRSYLTISKQPIQQSREEKTKQIKSLTKTIHAKSSDSFDCAICRQKTFFKHECAMCKRIMCINHIYVINEKLVCSECVKKKH